MQKKENGSHNRTAEETGQSGLWAPMSPALQAPWTSVSVSCLLFFLSSIIIFSEAEARLLAAPGLPPCSSLKGEKKWWVLVCFG